jgi:hypothetical protein
MNLKCRAERGVAADALTRKNGQARRQSRPILCKSGLYMDAADRYI